MMGQSMECWSTTSVHLVTVSVVEWIMIVVDVIVSTIMMMMIVNVFVIEKVHTRASNINLRIELESFACAHSKIFCTFHIIIMYTIGYLCGQCRNGKGVSALLNNCVSCERTSVLLIIALGMYIHRQ